MSIKTGYLLNNNPIIAEQMRIAKFIAAAGICSRRAAEKLIEAGRVRVDGKILITPALNIDGNSKIEVDGKVIRQQQERARIWIYYKPAGLITTHKDPQNRPTVFDALRGKLPRVISVGRLDLNSEGLLLLTSSGELARSFELPANGIIRKYKVRAYGDTSRLENFISNNCGNGLEIKIDGIIYRPSAIELKIRGKLNSWFEVSLTEGKNREIRKIFKFFDLEVSRLIRISYGEYELGGLKPGEFREVLYKH